jgi:hypothetical protein
MKIFLDPENRRSPDDVEWNVTVADKPRFFRLRGTLIWTCRHKRKVRGEVRAVIGAVGMQGLGEFGGWQKVDTSTS